MRTYRSISATIVCLLTLWAGGIRATAQEKPVRQEGEAKQRVIAEDTFKVLTAKMSADHAKVVKGAPYSATAVTESTQNLTDGNQIIQRKETAYYRDGEGRTRIDERLDMIGKWTAAGEPPLIIMISDPVAGAYYNLNPSARTARQIPQGSPFKPEAEAAAKLAREYKEQQSKSIAVAKLKEKSDDGSKSISLTEAKQSASPKEAAGEGRKKTSLGKRTIEGIEAEGTQFTLTIPAGQIGNTLPIEIVDERWYSPDLQLMVMTRHRDPRSGEVIWRLTNINRNEPDRSLFQVPADYTIIDNSTPKSRKLKPEEK